LAVDSRGRVYLAATDCGCVIKIAIDGKITTVLKAEKPSAPSGVAVHNEDIYVLEHITAVRISQHSCTHVNVFLDTGRILRSWRVQAYPNTVPQSMSRVAAPEL